MRFPENRPPFIEELGLPPPQGGDEDYIIKEVKRDLKFPPPILDPGWLPPELLVEDICQQVDLPLGPLREDTAVERLLIPGGICPDKETSAAANLAQEALVFINQRLAENSLPPSWLNIDWLEAIVRHSSEMAEAIRNLIGPIARLSEGERRRLAKTLPKPPPENTVYIGNLLPLYGIMYGRRNNPVNPGNLKVSIPILLLMNSLRLPLLTAVVHGENDFTPYQIEELQTGQNTHLTVWAFPTCLMGKRSRTYWIMIRAVRTFPRPRQIMTHWLTVIGRQQDKAAGLSV